MQNKDFESGFKNLRKTAEETFEEIENKSQKSFARMSANAKASADYQAEYDEMMSQKRVRSFSTEENKRLQILRNNISYCKSLRQGEYENLKSMLNLGEISNDEYYTRLADFRDAYFEKGTAEWNKYTLEIIKYNRSVVEEQQNTLNEMISDVEEKYKKGFENIQKKQTAMQNKLDDTFGVYETVHFDMGEGKESEWLRLADVDEDLRILKNYNNSLMNVKNKINAVFDEMGMDSDKSNELGAKFFEQITDLSVGDGIAFANHINNQSTDTLAKFMEKWVEKVDLTEMISKNFYADESKHLLEEYANDMSLSFSQTLCENFGKIPESFFANGKNSALEFKNGFLSAMDDAISEISMGLNEKIASLMPDLSVLGQGNYVTNNNSSYNIYGVSSPEQTVLEIYKQDEKKKMLTGN